MATSISPTQNAVHDSPESGRSRQSGYVGPPARFPENGESSDPINSVAEQEERSHKCAYPRFLAGHYLAIPVSPAAYHPVRPPIEGSI